MNRGEWQAVVLCGGVGNRMIELTERIPKCLLPIAGIPMFWYPLYFLQRNAIHDVLLVMGEKQIVEARRLLTNGDLPSLSDLNIEFVPLTSIADDWGTADVLRHIDCKIKRDFIVVSGDFVSDMSLSPMLAVHRAGSAALTCLLAENVVTGPVPGPKIKRSKGRDFVALHESNQLLFMGSEDDFDESIPINSHLFAKFKNVNLTAKFNDCHVYVMKRWILDIVKKERSFSSIKADLVPYLLEKQYAVVDAEMAPRLRTDRWADLSNVFSFGTSTLLNEPRVRCFAYVVTPENGSIIAHVNTIGAYFEVNKAIVRFLPTRFLESFPSLASADLRASASVTESYISKEAHVADEASLPRSDKPVIKHSVIGAKCTIAPRTRITNSLIMNSCIIAQGAQITNSILCSDVEVEEGADVTSCIVVNRQKIVANSKVQSEIVSPDGEMDMDD